MPSGQTVQFAPPAIPAFEKVPRGQAAHTRDELPPSPHTDTLPLGHAVHVASLVCPTASENVPAGHRLHASARSHTPDQVPGGQRVHAASSLSRPAPGWPNVPGGQAAQVPIAAVDPTAVPNEPAAHTGSQVVRPRALAEPLTGHETQSNADAAPTEGEAVPRGQAEHCVEPRLLLYIPGAQGVHVEFDTAPATTLTVPRGHGVHAKSSDEPFGARPKVPGGHKRH